MAGSEDFDSYQAFIGFNEEELANYRIMEREMFQKQPTSVTMERLLILNALSDLQLTKESLEDGIRMMADPRLMVSQEVSGKVLTRLWIGLRRLILVQKYLHLAAHKSVQLVIKYLTWQATAEETDNCDEDALASQRNFVSSLKKMSFVTSPDTEQMFANLVVPEYDDIVKQIKSGAAGLMPVTMRKDNQFSSDEVDHKDLEELIDIKSEEASDASDEDLMKLEEKMMTSMATSVLQGEFDGNSTMDMNEYLSIDMKQKEMEANLLRRSRQHEGMGKSDLPSSQDEELKFVKEEESTKDEDANANSTSDEKPHRCTICGKCYPSNSKLQDHLNAHSGVKPHQCDVCSKSFYSKDLRRQHQKVHKLPCEFCQVVFNTKSALNRHVQNVHGSQSPSRMETGELTSEENNMAEDTPRVSSREKRQRKTASLAESEEEEEEDIEFTSNGGSKYQHKCSVCGKCYASNSKLQDHINTHTGERPHQCDICQKAFGSKDALRGHQEIHSATQFHCDQCGKMFNTRTILYKHRQKEHYGPEDTSQQASNGQDGGGRDRSTPSEGGIDHKAKPSNSDEAIKENYKCRICGRGFRSNSKLQDHINTHTGERPHQCKVCNKAFGSKDALRGHQEIHSATQFNCEQCGKMFNTRTLLYKHRQKEHSGRPDASQDSNNGEDGDKDALFECDICNAEFDNRSEFRDHQVKEHNLHQETEFDVKDLSHDEGKGKMKTKKASSQEELNMYSCHVCNKEFKTKKVFKQHINRNLGKKPLKCEVCNCMFHTEQRLMAHMDNHSETFMCDLCGKTYNLRKSLRLHVLTVHRGDKGRKKPNHKKEMCIYCGIVMEKRYLRYHIYRHTGEKPFKCKDCPKAFTTPTDLHLHKDIHSSKTFLCPSCGKVFNTYASLRTHKRKMHRNLMAVKAKEEEEGENQN